MTWISSVFDRLTGSTPPASPTPPAVAAPVPAVSTVDGPSDLVVLPDGLPPISRSAVDLIIHYEVTDRRTYELRHARPTWPGASSGVTIGIGYDLGYVTAAAFAADWLCLPSATRERLVAVVGGQGTAARGLVRGLADITVPWDDAMDVLIRRTLPTHARRTLTAFPAAATLPSSCYGALVSLVFNRGPGMSGDRRREMRDVRDHLASGRMSGVAPAIRAMSRIWVGTSIEAGMRHRREAEADLFEQGIAAAAVA